MVVGGALAINKPYSAEMKMFYLISNNYLFIASQLKTIILIFYNIPEMHNTRKAIFFRDCAGDGCNV